MTPARHGVSRRDWLAFALQVAVGAAFALVILGAHLVTTIITR